MKSKQQNQTKRGTIGIGNTKADAAAQEAMERPTETYVARANRQNKRAGKGRDEGSDINTR